MQQVAPPDATVVEEQERGKETLFDYWCKGRGRSGRGERDRGK